MTGLSIPHHVVGSYRLRVNDDGWRFERTNYEIRLIVLDSFYNGVIEMVGDFNRLVKFEDKIRKFSFGPYYLVVEKDKFNLSSDEGYCIKTILTKDSLVY